MTSKPIVPRRAAEQDTDNAIAYLLLEAGQPVALAFVDALEAAYRTISEHPAAGSPRFSHELNLPGLRTWPLRGFAYLIFYVERADHVDVWRLLDGRRDIPAWLSDPEE